MSVPGGRPHVPTGPRCSLTTALFTTRAYRLLAGWVAATKVAAATACWSGDSKAPPTPTDEGDQIVVTNDGVSWLPGGGNNARAGYYDFNARTVRLTAGNGGNAGGLLGNGLFYFREFTVDERGQEIEELTTYYIIEVSR